MQQHYEEYLRTIYAAEEMDVFYSTFALVERIGLEQYEQDFESLIGLASERTVTDNRDAWHNASLNTLLVVAKALGIFVNENISLHFLCKMLTALLELEEREDIGIILPLFENEVFDQNQLLAEILNYMHTFDQTEVLLVLDRVHDSLLIQIRKMAAKDEGFEEDVETPVALPPLAANIRYLINEDIDFLIFNEIKNGLMVGLSMTEYLNLYWNRISDREPKSLIRELIALMLISSTPPHQMLEMARKIIGDRVEDISRIRLLVEEATQVLAQVLLQKPKAL